MKQMFQKLNELRVLSIFLENPFRRRYLREIARELKMSPATVLRALRSLIDYELIVKVSEYRGAFFQASNTPYFKALKIAYGLEKLENKKFIEEIKTRTRALASVVIFGSMAKGEDTPESDLDILVIASRIDLKPAELSSKINRDVNLHTYTIAEWKKVKEQNKAFYLDVLSSGILLYGQKMVI